MIYKYRLARRTRFACASACSEHTCFTKDRPMPLNQEDQVYLKKYIGPNYEKYNSILRGRADKLFMNDKAVDVAKLGQLFSGEYGGFRGLLDDCVGIVRALSHVAPYSGKFATRGVNNFKGGDGQTFLEKARAQKISGTPYSEPGFMSTTAGGCMWPKEILIVIDLTAAADHGGRVLPGEAGGYAGEGECLFLPAAPFRVTNVEGFGDKYFDYVERDATTSIKALLAFKQVITLQAMPYPDSELDPATATWLAGGQGYARNFEKRLRNELLDLSVRDDQFQSDALVSADLEMVTSKIGLRKMLDAMRGSGDLDADTYSGMLSQHKVTDPDIAALKAVLNNVDMPEKVKRSFLGLP